MGKHPGDHSRVTLQWRGDGWLGVKCRCGDYLGARCNVEQAMERWYDHRDAKLGDDPWTTGVRRDGLRVD